MGQTIFAVTQQAVQAVQPAFREVRHDRGGGRTAGRDLSALCRRGSAGAVAALRNAGARRGRRRRGAALSPVPAGSEAAAEPSSGRSAPSVRHAGGLGGFPQSRPGRCGLRAGRDAGARHADQRACPLRHAAAASREAARTAGAHRGRGVGGPVPAARPVRLRLRRPSTGPARGRRPAARLRLRCRPGDPAPRNRAGGGVAGGSRPQSARSGRPRAGGLAGDARLARADGKGSPICVPRCTSPQLRRRASSPATCATVSPASPQRRRRTPRWSSSTRRCSPTSPRWKTGRRSDGR